jgi:hypothetical protein
MLPIKFPQSNRDLLDNGHRSENVKNIETLHIFSDNEMCISCWEMTWKERFSALFFGKTWLYVVSGNNQPPVSLLVKKDIF